MRENQVHLAGVRIIEPRVFDDERGFFMETWSRSRFAELELGVDFVQDNYSRSVEWVLRGLHYQIERPQGKLIWVAQGDILDVAVDLRRRSVTFGKWMSVSLSEHNHRQVYLPPGIAHGFCVVSKKADVIYKCTDVYFPQHERTLLWNDPQIGIEWPTDQPIVSAKDKCGCLLRDAPTYD